MTPHIDVARNLVLSNGLRLFEKAYDAGLRMPRHAHDEWRYCLAIRGAYTDSWRGSWRTRTPSHLSLHPAEETHTSAFHSAATCFHIEFGSAWRDRLLGDAGITAEPHEFLGGHVNAVAERMYAEFRRKDRCSELVLEGLACELIGLSGRSLHTEANGAEWVYRARDLLRERFRESLSLAEVAAAVDVHPVHLARQFRRTFGCSVGEFVRGVRVDVACRALRTDASLSAIALDAGFADQSHFTRMFKRATGRTPGEFRGSKADRGSRIGSRDKP